MGVADHTSRRHVLAGIGATTIAVSFKPAVLQARTPDQAPNVLVFDVAETLLNLASLRPLFQRWFGAGAVVDEWFGETILYSESATLTNTFVPFGALGAGVLRMLGQIHGVPIGESHATELAHGVASLPPHPDVPQSLRRLKAAGFRMVTLTDSPTDRGQGALHAAGLADLFEQQFTAEAVRRYKPAHQTYHAVAEAMGAAPSQLCMIASHPWDLIGAHAAGCMAALIARPGVRPLLLPNVKQPEIIAPSLTDIAAQLVQLKQT